jgi:radical SAM modification target selenobiotic family peptide
MAHEQLKKVLAGCCMAALISGAGLLTSPRPVESASG